MNIITNVADYIVPVFVDWCARQLMPEQLTRHLTVEVCFAKNLRSEASAAALCCPIDKQKNARHFLIRVEESDNYQEKLTNIAHELVHVKQIATGELYFEGMKCFYNGKLNNSSYENQPWEIEARKKQDKLVNMFF